MSSFRLPTIIDVARKAGVSKTTVGRVVSGASNVSAEGKRRVVLAIEQCGYEPNRLALGLRTGKSQTLGMLIPDMANMHWADVARGAQDEAERHGYVLIISNSDWDTQRERRHLEAMRRNRVDGLIVNPTDERIAWLRRLEIPVVILGSSGVEAPELSCVRNDIEQGVDQAFAYLAGLGHSDIGLIAGRRSRNSAKRFLSAVHGVREAKTDLRLRIEEGNYTAESGYEACRRLLDRDRSRPTAIFAANDMMALGATQAVRDSGLSCPDDVSVIGMDGISTGAFSSPGLTTISKDRYEMGSRAAAHLVAMLTGSAGPIHDVLPCKLVKRGSVAEPNTSTDAAARRSEGCRQFVALGDL